MAGTVTLYQLKDPTTLLAKARQMPIYIGRALVVQNVILNRNPNVWIDIPVAESGTEYVPDSLPGTIRYWKVFGKAKVNWTSSDKTSVILTNQDFTFNSTLTDLNRCTAFFVKNGELLFSNPIIDLDIFIHNDGLYPLEFRMLSPLDNPIGDIDVYLAAITDTTTFTTQPFDTQLRLDTLPDEIDIPGVNTIVNIDVTFLYQITDFRYFTLTSQDVLPFSTLLLPMNPMIIAANLHRQVSQEPMTLFTIPNESLDSINNVLDIIITNPAKYGYSIIPLFYDAECNNAISAFCTSLEIDAIGYMICYLNGTLKETHDLITANATSHY